ncbi:MAG: ABC transporter permease, partial [Actinomycetota bacterium]
MTRLARDLRFTLKQARRSAGISITAIVTLAIGIGAATTMFAIVESVLLRPLPFPHPQQLVLLGDHVAGTASSLVPAVPAPEIHPYIQDTHSFQGVGAYGFTSFDLSGIGAPTRIMASRMSPATFAVLGIQPLFGRTFTREEDSIHAPVTVLSFQLWQSRFWGDPDVLGKTILLDRRPYQVIGVMPSNFAFPVVAGSMNQAQLWVPLSLSNDELRSGVATWSFYLVGRLKPHKSRLQAQADAGHVAKEIMRGYPGFMATLHIDAVVSPLHDASVVSARPLLNILWSASLVILILACVNVAGLLLVRAMKRRRDVAVQLALGADRRDLLRQSILEGVFLSATGGAVGIAAARLFLHALVAILPDSLPRANEIRFDWLVASIALVLTIFTGFACSLAPAFAGFRSSVNEGLREAGSASTGSGGHARIRAGLVVAEIAMTLVLISSSFLLLRSFQKALNVSLGFNPQNVAVGEYFLPKDAYSSQAA